MKEPPTEPSPESRPAEKEAPRGKVTETTCDLCGTVMYEWHCRIVCQSCGYQRDCSDP